MMWNRILGSKVWRPVILGAGLVAVLDAIIAPYIGATASKAIFVTCAVALFLCAPASAFRKREAYIELGYIRPKPLPDGKCRSCGYNLTGNVSGVCPECGTPIEKVAPTVPDFRDELRKHRSGDIPGIVIFGVLTLGGVVLAVVGHGEMRGVGIVVAWMCAGGILMCALDLRWMRRGAKNGREK